MDRDVTRRRLHTRQVLVDGYERDDGLWDIEGRLIDTKGYDFPRSDGTLHPQGEPVHEMRLRLTVDDTLTIRDARTTMRAVPYAGLCEGVTDAYRALVGLRIAPGFRKAVLQRFGGERGCTHLTELLWPMATTAVQTLSRHRREQTGEEDPKRRPFQIGGCHAWSRSGPLVARLYPRWWQPAEEPDSSG